MKKINASGKTVWDWRQIFFKEICFDVCINNSFSIGGVGIKVDIVESTSNGAQIESW